MTIAYPPDLLPKDEDADIVTVIDGVKYIFRNEEWVRADLIDSEKEPKKITH